MRTITLVLTLCMALAAQAANVLALLAPLSPPVPQFGVGQPIPCLVSPELTNGTLSVGYSTSPLAVNFTA